MLPFFNVTLAEATNNKMTHLEVRSKNRRKKLEVPIHGAETEHKTYSANFNARRKQKNVGFEGAYSPNHTTDFELAIPEKPDGKISRKLLTREIDKLTQEKNEIIDKFNNDEILFTKKITRLKEKLNSIQNINDQIQNENNVLRTQYQDVVLAYEEIKTELELKRNCETCEQLKQMLEKSNADYNLLRSNNKDLLEDISMLKNVVYRLNVQMERYQEKLRKQIQKTPNNMSLAPSSTVIETLSNIESGYCANEILTENHREHPHVPVSWGKVNAHTLGPLLDSYQDTIAEKEEIIERYETEMSNFTGKLKEIVRENETLHKRLTEDNECSKKLIEELEHVKAELKGARDQNDILIKKCALKQDKVEEIVKCYEQKVEQLKRDYKVVHEEYLKGRSEIISLKEKTKALIDAKEEFKSERENYIPVSVHAASVNECKKLYEELKQQYENEKLKLKETISIQNDQITEASRKISTLNSEKEALENKIKSLEKHIKKAEAKYLEAQHTLKEVQLSRSACRKQLHKAMNFAKDLVTEQETLLRALSQRQHENKIVKKLGSEIANRMDSLKSQLKSVQHDAWQELTTVEERLKQQDAVIASMKQDHNEEVARLKEIIKEKDKNLLLKEDPSSIPMPHYLLFRDRNLNA